MTLPELIELMKTGGPYSVILALVIVVRHLYVKQIEDKRLHDVEKQALNDRIVKVVENQNEALARAIENQHHTSEALARSVDNQQLMLQAVESVRLVGRRGT